jgi:hypothetical protein
MKTTGLFLIAFLITIQAFPQKKRGAGLSFDDAAYENTPIAEMPKLEENDQGDEGRRIRYPAVSLKPYAPTPRDQGSYNNCVGWSTAYVARTIIEAQTRKWISQNTIDNNAFAPGFIYKLISDDDNCYQPTSIDQALQVMADQGVAKFKDLNSVCPSGIPQTVYAKASLHRIKSHKRLFFLDSNEDKKVESVKRSLINNDPVVIGMRCPPSFEFAEGKDIWKPKESPQTNDYFGHAMCVIGYDDNKYGGAFEIQNSWGKAWGNNGFIWIRYRDFANFAKYAYILEAYPLVFPTVVAPFNRRIIDSIKTPDASLGAKYSLKNLFDLGAQVKIIDQNETDLGTTFSGAGYRLDPLQQNKPNVKLFINNLRSEYVYAFTIEGEQRIELLLPRSANDQNTFFKENEVVELPDGPAPMRLSTGSEKGHLCIFFSKNPLNMPEIVKNLGQKDGDIHQKIEAVIGERLVDQEDISFFQSEMAFSAMSRGKEIVALIIEMK